MIIKREWTKLADNGLTKKHCAGYFLFGIIPIYISIVKKRAF